MSSTDHIGGWVDPRANTDVVQKRIISVLLSSQLYLNELSWLKCAIGGHHNNHVSPKTVKSRDALESVYLQNYWSNVIWNMWLNSSILENVCKILISKLNILNSCSV
jgi:hypothetical protein